METLSHLSFALGGRRVDALGVVIVAVPVAAVLEARNQVVEGHLVFDFGFVDAVLLAAGVLGGASIQAVEDTGAAAAGVSRYTGTSKVTVVTGRA